MQRFARKALLYLNRHFSLNKEPLYSKQINFYCDRFRNTQTIDFNGKYGFILADAEPHGAADKSTCRVEKTEKTGHLNCNSELSKLVW